MRIANVTLLVALFGCSSGLRAATDDLDTATEADTDTDTDTDTDADTDSDSDSDTDTDTDTDTDALACTGNYPTGNPGWGGSTCLTADLYCGNEIEGTTVGGSVTFDHEDYDDMGCNGQDDLTDTFSSAERVYELWVPADTLATVTLEQATGCNDLSLRVLETSERCTHYGLNTTCSAYSAVDPWTQEVDNLYGRSSGFFFQVIVDGKNGATAPYRLRVECASR